MANLTNLCFNDICNTVVDAYSKTEVNALIDAIVTGEFVVAEELPETGEPKNIYLVPNNGPSGNIYDEYLYVGGKWEKIGTTEIDLSGYVTAEQLNTALAGKQDTLTKAAILSILGYEEITLSKTDENGNIATAHVLGYVDNDGDSGGEDDVLVEGGIVVSTYNGMATITADEIKLAGGGKTFATFTNISGEEELVFEMANTDLSELELSYTNLVINDGVDWSPETGSTTLQKLDPGIYEGKIGSEIFISLGLGGE